MYVIMYVIFFHIFNIFICLCYDIPIAIYLHYLKVSDLSKYKIKIIIS